MMKKYLLLCLLGIFTHKAYSQQSQLTESDSIEARAAEFEKGPFCPTHSKEVTLNTLPTLTPNSRC